MTTRMQGALFAAASGGLAAAMINVELPSRVTKMLMWTAAALSRGPESQTSAGPASHDDDVMDRVGHANVSTPAAGRV